MKVLLTQFLVQSVTYQHYPKDKKLDMPYYYFGRRTSGCYKNNFSYNLFSTFNSLQNTTEHEESYITDIIFNTFKIKTDNTRLIIFTVINTNDSKHESVDHVDRRNSVHSNTEKGSARITNNPPLPPYINVNEIKKFLNYRKYFTKIKEYIRTNSIQPEHNFYKYHEYLENKVSKTFEQYKSKFMDFVLLSPYYNNDEHFKKKLYNPEFLQFSSNIDITVEILNIIEMNNETTLIGTLNFSSFNEVQKQNELYPVCDGVYNEDTKQYTMLPNYSDIVNFNKMLDLDEDDEHENLHLEAGSPGLLLDQQSTLNDEEFTTPLRRPSLQSSRRQSFIEESKDT